MKFSAVFAAAALVAGAYATKNETVAFTTTEVVTAYTTYCPLPTTIVENNTTYTVTEATTLTITNCPCTRTKTYTTVTATVCDGGCPTDEPKPVYPNVTVSIPPVSPPANTSAPIPPESGASGRGTVAAGALAGLIAAAAYLL